MLRLVKWAHDLGVKHERERIARSLERVCEANRDYISTGYDMLREDNGMSNRSKKNLEKQVALRTEINQVVMAILEPQYEPSTESASIMFPKETK